MSKLINLQSFIDGDGSLIIGEVGKNIPFPIKRFFAISNVKVGDIRGNHAHKKLNQILVCLSGSVEVNLNDGRRSWSETLDQPGIALHIPPMIWAQQIYNDPNTVLIVLCDEIFQESDYLRNFQAFCNVISKNDTST